MSVAQRPLSGIRVLDFGHHLAGPLVGMMLADLGAEVIRIDRPGSAPDQDPVAAVLSRGKRALTLDLKREQDRRTALALCERADVVIENFRPGVMARLGLGAEVLRAANPSLVTLSLPGFASTDPELAPLAAWEAIIAARTGQFTDMGLNRRLMGINPSFTPLTMASAYGACFGAMAVQFALAARERCGGEHIEVPLAAALLEGLVYNCEQIEDYPERYRSPREQELERRAAAGLPMDLEHAQLSELLDPFYRTYTCADGRGFYVVACSLVGHPQRALRVLGLDALADELPDFDAYLDSADWPDSWSLRNYPVGAADRARVAEAMKAAFLRRPSHEWEALFGAAKAPGTAQRSSAEWLRDPHALASGLVLPMQHPVFGAMRQMGNVAWLADDPEAAQKRPCEKADLAALLQEPPRAASAGATGGLWLDGLQVLDLCNVIAGPTIGSTLARFGAEVTHVQPVQPSVDPWNAVVFGLQAQRGKRSLLLDLGADQGRAVLAQLIERADVITLNGTDAQRDKLGLGHEALQQLNPRAILVQLDAFGGVARGPKSDDLGYDDLAQAATGVMLRFGGGMQTPEEHAHFGTIDALTGYAACVALGAALVQRERTGRGAVARASLAAAGNLIQAPFMFDYPGRAPFDEPAGRAVKGWGPFYHCYRAADQWLFLAAPRERHRALARCAELADLADLDGEALREALAERLAHKPCAHWQAAFAAGSSAVVALGSLHATRDASLQRESEGGVDINQRTFSCVRHDRHPMGRWVDLVAPNAVRPDRASIVIPGDAPQYGADSRRVLEELGLAPAQVERLIGDGVVAERWSEKYLPD